MSHTGALVGSDEVFSAALERSGVLRVEAIGQLFAAARALSSANYRSATERLVVVTNGGGPGVMAVDRLIDLGGTLAELTPETIDKLDAVLPATWSRSNPVDIIGDAPGSRYTAALEILLQSGDLDAV